MIRIGIIGMGGFAASHQDAVVSLESERVCKLVCACDPEYTRFSEEMLGWNYSGRGVKVFGDYLTMLNACKEEIDMVMIPTPINLHAQMHKAAVERGIPVYLEKPPTLDYMELESMLAAEKKATKATNVGFNYIIESTRQDVKSRSINGEFGHLHRIELFGNWPRPDTYFTRNNWAGKLMLNDSIVIDSIMGNAMAHYVHNALYWAGAGDVASWSGVKNVSAELYRANNIKGTDTVFLNVQTDTGVEIRIALTHACSGEQMQYERLHCDSAVIDYCVSDKYIVKHSNGCVETETTDSRNLLVENIRHYCSYIAGNEPRPVNRLVDCIPFVHVNDLAYIASGSITTIPAHFIHPKQAAGQNGTVYEIESIEQITRTFVETGRFPSDQNVLWAMPGSKANICDLVKFRHVIENMVC